MPRTSPGRFPVTEEEAAPVNCRHGRRSVENPGVLIPLGGPEAGGRTGSFRGTDRSLAVAAPFILAQARATRPEPLRLLRSRCPQSPRDNSPPASNVPQNA